MLAAVLLVFELSYKALTLAVTVSIAHYLTTEYITALIEATKAYLAVLDLIYARDRLPLRV